MKKTFYIVGIAGGSGSGKTTFAKKIKEHLGAENCALVLQDSYYFDQSSKFDGDGGSVNFDHPDSIDFDLMYNQIAKLKNGQGVDIPIYEFSSHRRLNKTEHIASHQIILVDGILIFANAKLLSIFNDLIFIDIPEETRLKRRLKRDVEERGRTEEGVKLQFLKQVKPMHDQFVEPSKQFATTVINSNNYTNELWSTQCRLMERLIPKPS